MKKFLQENWFKLGVLIILLMFLLIGTYVLLFKKDINGNYSDNPNTVNGAIATNNNTSLSTNTPPEIENQSEVKGVVKTSNPKVLTNNLSVSTQNPVVSTKTTAQPGPTTQPADNIVLYNHNSFVAEISDVYKKVINDFTNSVNINIMTLIYKKDIGQASGYVNSGYYIISEQREKIKNIESRYKNLNYEDGKILYAMKNAVDNYYLSLITEKKISTRNGSEYGVQDYDIKSIDKTNGLASSYLDDVYKYLLLQ